MTTDLSILGGQTPDDDMAMERTHPPATAAPPRQVGAPLFSVAPNEPPPTAAPPAPGLGTPTNSDAALSAAAAAAVAAADEAARRADRSVPEGNFSTVGAVPAIAGGPSLAVEQPNDGLPLVLDPYAVAMRAVQVLIGSPDASRHIARRAIEMSIEHDASAALDVVVPRAIDLVLRRAAHLVSIGVGARVVDHYSERLELWRRLACRRGLEPAAIVLMLAPFPIPTVAAMLRAPLVEVEAAISAWYAGIDPVEALAPTPTAALPALPAAPEVQVAEVQEADVVPLPADPAADGDAHRGASGSRPWIRWRAKGA